MHNEAQAPEKINVVLIAEDNKAIQDMLVDMIGESDKTLEVIQCMSMDDALDAFTKHLPRLKLILIDGNMPQRRGSGISSTIPLAKLMRKNFSGVMVAISGDEAATMQLAQAGCDHAIDKTLVTHLIALMKKLLGPPPRDIVRQAE